MALNPIEYHSYKVKLGFSSVYIILLICALKYIAGIRLNNLEIVKEVSFIDATRHNNSCSNDKKNKKEVSV